MAVIELNSFGGMAPSANAAYVDQSVSALAKDVNLRFKDFRPYITPSNVTTATSGGTLYKFSNSPTFLTKPGDVNFVRGPVPNDATERTYYTGDGVPKVTDLTLAVRQLGVPKPTTAPTTAIVKNTSFSTGDAENAKFYAPSFIFTAVKTNAIQGVYSGMLDADLTDLSSTSRPWEYSLVRNGSLVSGNFVPTVASDICLADPALEYVTDSTTIRVPLFVRARRYVADNTTLTSVLTAIPSPDVTQPTAKMLNATQVTALAAGIQAHLVSRDNEINDLIAKVKAIKQSFVSLVNSPTSVSGVNTGANAAVYTTTYGTTALSDAVARAANRVLDSAADNDGDVTLTYGNAVTAINSYIVTASNGLKSVNVSGLENWIYTKVKPIPYGYIYDQAALHRDSSAIALDLKTAVEDIAKQTTSAANVTATVENPLAAVTKQLVEKQAEMERYIKQIEAIAQAVIDEGLQDVITMLFNREVAPSFPIGEVPIITPCAWVETYVTDWGEESAPSPVSAIVELDQNDGCTIGFSTVPSGRNITKRRLYRSASGSTTSAFLFQGEYPVATTSTVDNKKASLLGEACPTFGWDEPPASLSGLVAMPNGVMLGFTGDTIHACEPYEPYTFPAKYDITVEFPIVGIAVAGQTAIVGTTGVPYLVTGSDSMSLTAEKIASNQSCVAKRSMVAIGGAVVYASPDGLVLVQGMEANLITEDLISKADWATYNPSTIVAAEYEGRYCAFYTKTGGTKGCLVFDFHNKTLVDMSTGCDAVFTDKATDTMYILSGTSVKNYFPTTGTNLTASWKSKRFMLPAHTPFGWLYVDAVFGSVVVDIYANGTLFTSVTVTSNAPVRLPPGRHKEWQIVVTAACQVTSVTIASTTHELKRVAT